MLSRLLITVGLVLMVQLSQAANLRSGEFIENLEFKRTQRALNMLTFI